MKFTNGHALVAENLQKRFGQTWALRGLDLAVPAGTVCGVLGPNGAGKTTAVRILTTLSRPDGGRAVVAGYDVATQAEQARRHIGLAGQYAAVDELLTGRDNLRMFGRLYHLGRRLANRRADELIEQFGLADAATRLAKTYSGGMRRRLDLAASLIIAPDVLFLDEPTTGLDPTSRNAVWESVRGLVADGTTVLLTTQYLDEADQLADNIAVVASGRVVATGTPEELKAGIGGEQVDIVVATADDLAPAAGALARAAGEDPTVDTENRRLSVAAVGGAATLTAVVRELDAVGIAATDIVLRRPTLDEVFLRITGEQTGADTPITEPAAATAA